MKSPFVRKLVAGAALVAAAFSNPLQAALPTEVASVLEASIEASGGREAISAIKSTRLKGTFSLPSMGMNGTSEIVHAYPDKVYNVQELPGMGRIEQGFDGETGWARDPMQGFRLLSEGEVATLKQNEGIADMLDFESAYSSGEILEDAEVDGQSATVVKLVSSDTGKEETHFYSKESKLLVRIDTIADMGPMGEMPASMNIKSYGEQDGILYPAKMEMTNAGMLITLSFDSLEINPEIDDSVFATPQ
ncbi:hypothetical protein [Pelagicoccus mobilis]|uniref:Outer membrane lipoprotein-sorting protein n=1 Tax=Pelagicoccus mobilis TaxID=415221 RepID=A0A934VMZ2_9BACT|nr:hypothetical protein [Pelagicoccus mobilis]MBK1875692.1 hypothetical protein [Pelagicoccus mobilis]